MIKKIGVKNDKGKVRVDLLPPEAMFQLAKVYTIGADKYGDYNYMNGIKWSRIFGALLRHAWKFWAGERIDKEDGQHHLASVAWCALTLMEYERMAKKFDDRPEVMKTRK